MAGKRKQHTPAFKAQVALAAVRRDKTVNELARQYGVHPTLIHGWKKHRLAGADQVFTPGGKAGPADAEKAELFEQIGRLKMELEWLKKKSARSPDPVRSLVEADHPALSVRRQCELLGLNRSSLYYEPAAEPADNLRLMRLLDQEYTAHPFLGSRRLMAWLVERGRRPTVSGSSGCCESWGLEAIYPKPKLSAARAGSTNLQKGQEVTASRGWRTVRWIRARAFSRSQARNSAQACSVRDRRSRRFSRA